MSPLIIQNDDASQRLVRQYGIRGRVPVLLDEIIVPTSDIGDFAGRSPWESRVIAADNQYQAAAGAGTYGGLYITPGASGIFVVEQLICENATGVNQRLLLQLFTPASVATVTTTGTSAAVQLNGQILPSGFGQQAPVQSSVFHHTGHAAGAAFGNLFNTTGTLIYTFPRGMMLDGSGPHGPTRLAIQSYSANQATPNIGFVGSFYAVK